MRRNKETRSNTDVSSDELLMQDFRIIDSQVPTGLSFRDFLDVVKKIGCTKKVSDDEIIGQVLDNCNGE